MLLNRLKNILNDLVVVAYKVIGGYTKLNVRNQSILIAVEHRRALKRAQTYSIKEPETLDWIDNFEPNTCYFDIGANIGQYSLYPAKKYGKCIKIYAFEPQSSNYNALNKNILLNNLKKILCLIVLQFLDVASFQNCISLIYSRWKSVIVEL